MNEFELFRGDGTPSGWWECGVCGQAKCKITVGRCCRCKACHDMPTKSADGLCQLCKDRLNATGLAEMTAEVARLCELYGVRLVRVLAYECGAELPVVAHTTVRQWGENTGSLASIVGVGGAKRDVCVVTFGVDRYDHMRGSQIAARYIGGGDLPFSMIGERSTPWGRRQVFFDRYHVGVFDVSLVEL